jgi:SSS family solute:Na+ symporter
MATADVHAARRSLRVQLIVAAVIGVTLTLVGFALLGYFEVHALALPAGLGVDSNADKLFPHFIAFHLPPGVSGLLVAAMFAAAMSSVDSGVNSISAVVITDFFDRFDHKPQTQHGHMRLAQMLAFGIGSVAVIGSSFMGHVPGNITAVTSKTTNLLVTPIFALFFFALFVPFARPVGVLVGAVCGIATAVLIAFSGPIFGADPQTGADPVSFMWIGPAALLVNVISGSLVSLVLQKIQPGMKSSF